MLTIPPSWTAAREGLTNDPFLGHKLATGPGAYTSGVIHKFETNEGNPMNRISARFAAKVLPFLSEKLAAAR